MCLRLGSVITLPLRLLSGVRRGTDRDDHSRAPATSLPDHTPRVRQMPTDEPNLGCECSWTNNNNACDNSDNSYCWNACCLHPLPESAWQAYYDQTDPQHGQSALAYSC